jgi:hypothetical protein
MCPAGSSPWVYVVGALLWLVFTLLVVAPYLTMLLRWELYARHRTPLLLGMQVVTALMAGMVGTSPTVFHACNPSAAAVVTAAVDGLHASDQCLLLHHFNSTVPAAAAAAASLIAAPPGASASFVAAAASAAATSSSNVSIAADAASSSAAAAAQSRPGLAGLWMLSLVMPLPIRFQLISVAAQVGLSCRWLADHWHVLGYTLTSATVEVVACVLLVLGTCLLEEWRGRIRFVEASTGTRGLAAGAGAGAAAEGAVGGGACVGCHAVSSSGSGLARPKAKKQPSLLPWLSAAAALAKDAQ